MTELLILFIDGLPYEAVPSMPWLSAVGEKWPVSPGFGYSINIHAELFAGLTPDEIGYFGEWTFNPAQAPGKGYATWLPLLDRLCKPYYMNRIVQRLLTLRYAGKTPMPNLPIRHLDVFAKQGCHILSKAFPSATLFSNHPELRVLQYRGIPRKKGERDFYIYTQASEIMGEGAALFVPFPDLDGTGHRVGTQHPDYHAHLQALDRWCGGLAAKFTAQHPKGHVFVVSDHGMGNVGRGVRLEIEAAVGPPSQTTYHYFSDANFLRIWVFDPAMTAPIRQFVDGFGHGRLLTDAERKEFGLTSPDFGTLLFSLDEGLAFQPSTFARRIPKGMHGYHPAAASQKAVCAHIGPAWTGEQPGRMKDVYQMLEKAASDGW